MVYRKPIPPPEPSCTEFLECALTNPDPVALAMLLAATSVLLLVATLALAHVAGARSVLAEERRRVAAEAEAFAAFARRVAGMEATAATVTDGGPGPTTALGAPPPDEGLEQVRTAYRETVMAVPHYEEEYDESLTRNMAMEFGEDVASAVERGSVLTPQLKGTLVDRSGTANRQRAALLRQLDAEDDALEEAETTLVRARRSVDRLADAPLDDYSFDELVPEWRLLEDRREETEALLEERQETIRTRDREAHARPGGPTFEEYLYDPLEVDHPVLAEGAALVERIREEKRRVEAALATNA